MKCDKVQNSILDYIENNLTEKEGAEFTTHINTCKNCEIELKEVQEFLSAISTNKPEHPSENLRKNFEQMLSEEKQLQEVKVVKLKPKTNWKWYLQVAAGIALLISAFFLGKYQITVAPNTNVTAYNKQKIQDEKVLLSLIENQSASKRIQAVSYSEKFEPSDTKIIQALINRLFFDENTNVRLSAAEALSKFSSLEMVRSALIKSLQTEQNPSIQIELIQILAKIQEIRAIKPMQELLKKKEIPNYVKLELESNIATLL